MQIRKPVAVLAITQVISWGMLYYAFGVLASRIQADLALTASQTFGAFSWSVLVAGLAATPAGIAIDRHGGRWIMVAGSLVAALGLWCLAAAGSYITYMAAWTLIGTAMSLTLYEAAFATLNGSLSHDAARAISTVTLLGGLASTAFWPLTEALTVRLGWRDTLTIYALIQLLFCAPLHFHLDGVHQRKAAASHHAGATLQHAIRQPHFWLLATAFAVNAFIFAAISVHLIRVVRALGHSMEFALMLAALIGPMQVVGRLIERTWGNGKAPTIVGLYTFAGLPVALFAIATFGSHAWGVAAFCLLYGLSNGVLTILRGTLPAAMFGRRHYGAISGALAAPALLAKASGPLMFAITFDVIGARQVLLLLLAMSFISLFVFTQAIRKRASHPVTAG
ncbi:Nitrate/nitrite transporter NarK [Duganella sp. CF458]|uniref:MFS transporter n=1 Tax=Duganella sp. CF458 TaxID=1884368 RepID=UPI0008F3A55C|nr:MFS transporter [Duganella sp. CF458]SFF85341.1 Nitrate/nitrite transporter NarK [Duganella sp. CF458]